MHLSPTTQTHQPSPATQRPVNPAAWSLASTTWPAFFNVRYTTTNMTYHTSRPHKISTARHTEMKREFIARSLAWYWISNLVVMKSGLQRMNSGSPVSGDRTERVLVTWSDTLGQLLPNHITQIAQNSMSDVFQKGRRWEFYPISLAPGSPGKAIITITARSSLEITQNDRPIFRLRTWSAIDRCR